jgi:hypothetical protein
VCNLEEQIRNGEEDQASVRKALIFDPDSDGSFEEWKGFRP